MLFVVIREVQNTNSTREGYSLKTTNLSQAKRLASKNQAFHGTVLKIETEDGHLISIKENGKWEDFMTPVLSKTGEHLRFN